MNIYCSIDIETTGLNHRLHEMVQICILPLKEWKPLKDKAFYINVKADHPETADPVALKICNLDISKGISKDEAKQEFVTWFKALQECHGFKHIIPLGQNYSFDIEFIIDWLGFDFYHQYFSRSYRDTKMTAAFLADTIAPDIKTGLHTLCEYFNIDNPNHHDALNDAMVTAEVYKAQIDLIGKPSV
jgi:DNA polymerase III alpha subunit (gram-positive type)